MPGRWAHPVICSMSVCVVFQGCMVWCGVCLWRTHVLLVKGSGCQGWHSSTASVMLRNLAACTSSGRCGLDGWRLCLYVLFAVHVDCMCASWPWSCLLPLWWAGSSPAAPRHVLCCAVPRCTPLFASHARGRAEAWSAMVVGIHSGHKRPAQLCVWYVWCVWICGGAA